MLDRDADNVIEAGRSYPIWSPDQAFSAADAILEFLEILGTDCINE